MMMVTALSCHSLIGLVARSVGIDGTIPESTISGADVPVAWANELTHNARAAKTMTVATMMKKCLFLMLQPVAQGYSVRQQLFFLSR